MDEMNTYYQHSNILLVAFPNCKNKAFPNKTNKPNKSRI